MQSHPAPSKSAQLPIFAAASEARPHQLSGNASMLLDIVRFAAAIGVVATHSGDEFFGIGWSHNTLWGDIAVPVFFVLSGFVIRFVTRTREGNPREYYIDRASRIYSVAIPAMLLTMVCAVLCLLLDHGRFVRDWSPLFVHPVARLVANLTFLSQIWGHNTIPFIDGPFWSLGFECPYYVFYGFIFFLRGWKRIFACVALAALVGPQVVFLFPLWWSGVWLYDAYHRFRGKTIGMIAAFVLLIWVAISILPGFFGMGRFPFAIQTVFTYIGTLPNLLDLLGIPSRRATMYAYAAGLVSAAILMLALLAFDAVAFSPDSRLKKRVRRVADGTFILYLFHFPLLLLAAYAGFFRYQHNLRNLAILAVIVLFCVILAAPLDSLKLQMRRWLRSIIPA